MTEPEELKATDKASYSFAGLDIVHEVYDGSDKFKHRLTCLDFPSGDWVSYEWFAVLEIDGRKFMGCQDNWRPMFPACFEVKTS